GAILHHGGGQFVQQRNCIEPAQPLTNAGPQGGDRVFRRIAASRTKSRTDGGDGLSDRVSRFPCPRVSAVEELQDHCPSLVAAEQRGVPCYKQAPGSLACYVGLKGGYDSDRIGQCPINPLPLGRQPSRGFPVGPQGGRKPRSVSRHGRNSWRESPAPG